MLLAVLIALFAVLCSCGSSADRTADHFMSLLVAGKHLEAQEGVSTKKLRQDCRPSDYMAIPSPFEPGPSFPFEDGGFDRLPVDFD